MPTAPCRPRREENRSTRFDAQKWSRNARCAAPSSPSFMTPLASAPCFLVHLHQRAYLGQDPEALPDARTAAAPSGDRGHMPETNQRARHANVVRISGCWRTRHDHQLDPSRKSRIDRTRSEVRPTVPFGASGEASASLLQAGMVAMAPGNCLATAPTGHDTRARGSRRGTGTGGRFDPRRWSPPRRRVWSCPRHNPIRGVARGAAARVAAGGGSDCGDACGRGGVPRVAAGGGRGCGRFDAQRAS